MNKQDNTPDRLYDLIKDYGSHLILPQTPSGLIIGNPKKILNPRKDKKDLVSIFVFTEIGKKEELCAKFQETEISLKKLFKEPRSISIASGEFLFFSCVTLCESEESFIQLFFSDQSTNDFIIKNYKNLKISKF